eukprot:TRINITY_DN4027_c0_g1_i1.p1 TRINITY_DN4027_c0_g1~~TRINITY_DN4027_c0_g1_i1.p1  ORF type:complete len:1924 (+),score=338.74 TRINITY_DN4027_c0_g1_i1:67-5838(+)
MHVRLLYRDQNHKVPLPRSAKELHKITKSHLAISPKQKISIKHGNQGHEITDETLHTLSNNDALRVALIGSQAPELDIIEQTIDIAPSIQLLLNAGALDYTFETALAELIDNSIQATKENAGSRVIAIRISAQVARIEIADNGVGMTMDQLRNWARLAGTSDEWEPKPTQAHNFISSDLSRYGVGAKNAVFKLGSRAIVSSKTAGCDWVNELVLDKKALLEDGGKWETKMRTRPCSASEEQKSQFTQVLVEGLSDVYAEQYKDETQVNALCKWLAQTYHFYLHGPDGNVKPEHRSQEGAGATQATQMRAGFKCISLKVNSKSLRDIRDLQTRYIQESGENPLELDIVCDDQRTEAHVKARFLYFPLRDGIETLPDHLDRDYKDSSFPLEQRRNGIEMFWQGRRIVDARRDFLFFTEKKSTKDLPDKCYQRYVGLLFFNDMFPVTQNKTNFSQEHRLFHIATEGSGMERGECKKLESQFRKWLAECHATQDDAEAQLVLEKGSYEHSRRALVVREAKLNDTVVKKGTKVKLMRKSGMKSVVYGIVKEFYQSTGGEPMIIFTEFTTKEADAVTELPLKQLREVVSETAWKAHIRLQRNKLPSKMQFCDSNEVEPLKSVMLAGEILKYVQVEFVSTEGKRVKPASIMLRYLMTNLTTDTAFATSELNKPYENGLFCFTFNTPFNDTGSYKILITCESKEFKIPPLEHIMEIKPGKPTQAILEYRGDEKFFHLGTPFHNNLILFLCDMMNNPSPPPDGLPEATVFMQDRTLTLTPGKFVEHADGFALNGYCVDGKLNCVEPTKSIVLKCKVAGYGQSQIELNATGGKPASLRLSHLPDAFETGVVLDPPVDVCVVDQHDNIVVWEKENKIVVTGNVRGTLEQAIGENGIARFDDILLTSDVGSVAKLNFHGPGKVSAAKEISVLSSQKPASLQLFTPPSVDRRDIDGKLIIYATASEELLGLELRVLNAEGEVINNSEEWPVHVHHGKHRKNNVAIYSHGTARLPTLIPSKKTQISSYAFKCKDLLIEFELHVKAGKPHAFMLDLSIREIQAGTALPDFRVYVVDISGNKLMQGAEALSRIAPVLTIDSQKQFQLSGGEITHQGDYFNVAPLTILAVPGTYALVVTDSSGLQLACDPVELLIKSSGPARISITGLAEGSIEDISVENNTVLPDITVQIRDKMDNPVTTLKGKVEVVMDSNDDSLQAHGIAKLTQGSGVFRKIKVSANAPGTYEVVVKGNGSALRNVAELKFRLRVLGGRTPHAAELEHPLPESLVAGDEFPVIRMRIKAENGSYLTEINCSLKVKKRGARGAQEVVADEADGLFTFTGVAALEQAGDWELEIFAGDIRISAHALLVTPSEALVAFAAETMISEHISADDPVLSKRLLIVLEDKFGNRCEALAHQTAKLSVVVDEDELGKPPRLVSPTGNLPFSDGQAVANDVRLDDSGTTGSYRLCASVRGLEPAFAVFSYTDAATIGDEKQNRQRLAMLRAEKKQELALRESQLKEITRTFTRQSQELRDLKRRLERSQAEFARTRDPSSKLQELQRTESDEADRPIRDLCVGSNHPKNAARLINGLRMDSRFKDVFVVVEKAKIDQDRVERAIARFMAGNATIICAPDQDAAKDLKVQLRDANEFSVIALDTMRERFSSLIAAAKCKVETSGQKLIQFPSNIPEPTGFVGFAVNLLHFELQDADLRATIFFMFLKDTLVVETQEDMNTYLKRHGAVRGIVTLDGFKTTAGGIQSGGRSRDPEFIFAGLPHAMRENVRAFAAIEEEVAEYKRKCAEVEKLGEQVRQAEEQLKKTADERDLLRELCPDLKAQISQLERGPVSDNSDMKESSPKRSKRRSDDGSTTADADSRSKRRSVRNDASDDLVTPTEDDADADAAAESQQSGALVPSPKRNKRGTDGTAPVGNGHRSGRRLRHQ